MDVRWLPGRARLNAVDLGLPRQRLVLALLAIEANRVVATDRLTELIWGTDGEKERASLHAYISNLRRVLEPDRDRGPVRTVRRSDATVMQQLAG
jgi:DNA-binding SARP family transcriptional activator